MKSSSGRLMKLILTVCIVASPAALGWAQPVPFGPTTIVSLGSNGLPVPGGSLFNLAGGVCEVSEDGKRVLFASIVALDPLDTNQSMDIYLYDEVIGLVLLITKDSSGAALGSLGRPRISRDGRSMVAFGYIPGTSPPEIGAIHGDISDPLTPVFRRLTMRFDGSPVTGFLEVTAATPDLDYLVVTTTDFLLPPEPFESMTPSLLRSYRIRTADLSVERVVPACQYLGSFRSVHARGITHDGTRIFFESDCDALVPGDVNGGPDVFVRNFTTGQTTCVSVALNFGVLSPSAGFDPIVVSGDGNVFVMRAYLQTYLGPSAPLGLGLIWRNITTGEVLAVDTGDLLSHTIDCRQLSYDGSRMVVIGYDIATNGWVSLVKDLRGTHRLVFSRRSDGSPMGAPNSPFLDIGFYHSHWTVNERWIGGVMQTVPPNFSVYPPEFGETEVVKIDLGPARNLGGFAAGSNGVPEFRLVEGLSSPATLMVVVENLPPLAPSLMGLGATLNPTPFFGGIAWPWPPDTIAPFTADAQGRIVITTPIPIGLPLGYQLVAQVATADAGAPFGAALSNGLLFRIP